MVWLEKWYILTPLQKLPKNVRDLGKLIGAKDFKKLPKVQKIARSGHTGNYLLVVWIHNSVPTKHWINFAKFEWRDWHDI